MAMQVAADVFPIRYVCGFGRNLPDGVIAFDDLLQQAPPESPPEIERDGNPAAHVALVTFDVTPDGLVAVARNHAELIAGGLATLLEGGIEPDARLLGCCATGSFAGLALTMMPWLLSGGTLLLHHGFDADAFAAQCRDDRCDTVVVPGALVPQLAEAGSAGSRRVEERARGLARAGAARRQPGLAALQRASLIDMHIFGEIGAARLAPRRRRSCRSRCRLRAVMAPRGSANAVPVAEIARTATGTLALRGPMVPRHRLPARRRTAWPRRTSRPIAEGFVDTVLSLPARSHDRAPSR